MYNQVIILSVIISLIYTELTGYSAGLIISGYLALNLQNPTRLAFTLLSAGAAVLVCRLLAKGIILYGRRRFALMLLLTFFFSWGAGALGCPIPLIGVVLPGLLAREFDRQGFVSTGLSLLITTGATVLCLLLLGEYVELAGVIAALCR